MEFGLTNEDKEWIVKAVNSGGNNKLIRMKLLDSEYPEERIDLFLKAADEYRESLEEKKKEPKERDLNDEEEFEQEVKTYQENPEKLSWGKRRAVKKWLKNMNKYHKVLKTTLEGIKKENEFIKKNFEGETYKLEKEEKLLCERISEALIDSQEVIDIEHPRTGEVLTKENIKDLRYDELIQLMEDNVEVLYLLVNGKTE